MQTLREWLEERTGMVSLVRRVLDHPVPGGARCSYVLGSALLFTLLVQALTGILLSLNYAPTTESARASVAFIQDEVAAGRLVHGLHHWGASAMVALLGLHLLQVFLWGAYRKPREFTWILGVLLLLTTLGFAFTGSLLPWDQNAFWATKVGLSIAGTAPLLGGVLQRLLQGGAQIGNLTLTRFYSLHVIVLPIVSLGLVAAHLLLFLRRGVTPHWSLPEQEQRSRTEAFHPAQFARDALVMALVLGALLLLAINSPPALGPPADPTRPYEARPEWYFLFLYELLKHLEGPLEVVGTFVLPGLAVLFLLAVPFLDRSPGRSPLRRLPVVVPMLAGVLCVAVLTAQSALVGRQERLARQLQEQRREEVLGRGWELVRGQRCQKCHTIGAEGRDLGPNLTHYGATAPSVEAIVKHLKDPTLKYPKTLMPSFSHLPEEDLRSLAEFLRLQGAD
ncbi:MAG: cytochrome b N-terminal domain-containing protein [Acidobacteriota bacterium]